MPKENKTYRLDTISLKNYRCYDDSEHSLNLGKNVTVFIGENGSGKTAILTAIKKGISFILSKGPKQDLKYLGDGKDIIDSGIKVKDVRYTSVDDNAGSEYIYPVEIRCQGVVYGEVKQWSYNKPNKSTRVDRKGFNSTLDYFLMKSINPKDFVELPLLCYFSDSYPHDRSTLTKYEKDMAVAKQGSIERRAGYYHWDSPSTDFYFWKDLIVRALNRLESPSRGMKRTLSRLNEIGTDSEAGKKLLTRATDLLLDDMGIEYIKSYIKSFTKPFPTKDNLNFQISDFSVGSYLDDQDKEKYTLDFDFEDGHTCLFELLPEGHKRLIAIALEIACRFVILNRVKTFLEKSESPSGIVIIDELELHLHPTLAQEALIRLTHTFPNVQFIISTHSPAIISNIYNDGENNVVYKLTANHEFVKARNGFGMPYSDTLVNVMGSYGRMHLLDLFKQEYLDYKQDGSTDGINEVKDSLRIFYSNVKDADAQIKKLTDNWNQLLDED